MNKIIALSVGTMLVLAAIGTWAKTTMVTEPQARVLAAAMNPFNMMTTAKGLPVRNITDEAF